MKKAASKLACGQREETYVLLRGIKDMDKEESTLRTNTFCIIKGSGNSVPSFGAQVQRSISHGSNEKA